MKEIVWEKYKGELIDKLHAFITFFIDLLINIFLKGDNFTEKENCKTNGKIVENVLDHDLSLVYKCYCCFWGSEKWFYYIFGIIVVECETAGLVGLTR